MGGAWGFIEALRKPRQTMQAHNILNPGLRGEGGNIRVATGSPNLAAGATAATVLLQALLQHNNLDNQEN